MATIRHPVTGVLMNDITHLPRGKISDEERRTAGMLLTDGNPRWLVAAMLGRHPLALTGKGRAPGKTKRPLGGHLMVRHARTDQRQISLDDLFGPRDDEATI
jgi:hypothetical protein